MWRQPSPAVLDRRSSGRSEPVRAVAAPAYSFSFFTAGAAAGLISSLSRRDKLEASDR